MITIDDAKDYLFGSVIATAFCCLSMCLVFKSVSPLAYGISYMYLTLIFVLLSNNKEEKQYGKR